MRQQPNKHTKYSSRLVWSAFILLNFGKFDPTFSQVNPHSFQHLSTENGLSDNTANTIIQDNQGYMWIATSDGINKYNGYKSKVFRPSATDSFSPAFGWATSSFKDMSGRLWFGGRGVMVCNPLDGKFNSYSQKKDDPQSLGNNDVTAITQDENGTIWIGTKIGLFQFDEPSKRFIRYMHDTVGSVEEVYLKNRITAVMPALQGNLWVSTKMGLYKFSIRAKTFVAYKHDDANKNSIVGNHIESVCKDQTGALWILTIDSGISKFDIKKETFTTVAVPIYYKKCFTNGVRSIFADSKGKIWISTSFMGVVTYNPLTSEWTNYTHDIFDSKSISDDKIVSVYEDASGMIWIATATSGVERISAHPDKFTTYSQQPGKPYTLCENQITCFAEDKKGNLWLGSKSGLMYFDRAANRFQCYKKDENNANSISHNSINSVALDANNKVWVGTENGLNHFNPKTNSWKRFVLNKYDKNSLPNNTIYSVTVTTNGSVLVGSGAGISQLRSDKSHFDSRQNNAAIRNLLKEFYSLIFEDSRQTFWVSTSRSGILHLDANFKVLHSYRNSGGFGGVNVRQFVEDDSGNIWMASPAGLYVWKQTSQSFINFNTTKILDGEIRSVVWVNKSLVWVSNASGLVELKLRNGFDVVSAKQFSQSDGLQSNVFNNLAGLKLSSNELVFGGLKGFNLFRPESIVFNSFVPEVQLSSFNVFDKEYGTQMDLSQGLRLGYKQNFFSFDIASLSFDHPEKNEYGYQLEGFDKEMNYCGNRHFISYTNVPPGEYNLHIIGSNNDGIWNKKGRRIKITITPPFWQLIWVQILGALLICIAAYILYLGRIKKVRKEGELRTEINKQIAEARMAALRAQMNPHFIFNSLNSIQLFISESEKENALKYLSKFSKLIRLVLQNANNTTNTIADELSMLAHYLELEVLRFPNKFTYQFSIQDDIQKETISIPSMLLQPCVENAIIHGLLNKSGQGHLEISMRKVDSTIICTVADNGIGRTAAKRIKDKKQEMHESLGMKVTAERIEMIEMLTSRKAKMSINDLTDNNRQAMGTLVIIEIEIDE